MDFDGLYTPFLFYETKIKMYRFPSSGHKTLDTHLPYIPAFFICRLLLVTVHTKPDPQTFTIDCTMFPCITREHFTVDCACPPALPRQAPPRPGPDIHHPRSGIARVCHPSQGWVGWLVGCLLPTLSITSPLNQPTHPPACLPDSAPDVCLPPSLPASFSHCSLIHSDRIHDLK